MKQNVHHGRAAEGGVGLALSGGGFRATLFHLGSLWRLNELGWLPKLSRVCSVSGGSITAGLLGLRWGALDFDGEGVARSYGAVVVDPLRAFCARTADVWAVAGVLALRTPARSVSRAYAKHLFGDATLQSLPEDGQGPRFVIYATNLQTASSVRLSRPYIGDYKLGLYEHPTVSLSDAVAASSAFPPVLSPMKLTPKGGAWRTTEGATLAGRKKLRERLVLTDGGVYDNLGLENIWQRYPTVLSSDAGAPLPTRARIWMQTLRSLYIMGEQTRALRLRRLIEEFHDKERGGAYWGINTRIDEYGLADALVKDNAGTAALADLRTRLNAFSADELCHLINWGYALTDAAMRRFVLKDPGPSPRWPYPDHALS